MAFENPPPLPFAGAAGDRGAGGLHRAEAGAIGSLGGMRSRFLSLSCCQTTSFQQADMQNVWKTCALFFWEHMHCRLGHCHGCGPRIARAGCLVTCGPDQRQQEIVTCMAAWRRAAHSLKSARMAMTFDGYPQRYSAASMRTMPRAYFSD